MLSFEAAPRCFDPSNPNVLAQEHVRNGCGKRQINGRSRSRRDDQEARIDSRARRSTGRADRRNNRFDQGFPGGGERHRRGQVRRDGSRVRARTAAAAHGHCQHVRGACVLVDGECRYKLDGDAGHMSTLLSLLRTEIASDSSGGSRCETAAGRRRGLAVGSYRVVFAGIALRCSCGRMRLLCWSSAQGSKATPPQRCF